MTKNIRLILLFAAALMLLFAVPVALAHANLVRSEPAAGSAQRVPPTVVRLWFSEAIEPSFSSASVVDKSGTRVDKGDSHRMSDDPTGMEVSLNDNLPPGLYTVIWKTTSAVDGHVVGGSFPFTVGDVPLADSSPREIMSQVDTALANSAAPPLYQVVVRWLNVLLLSLLVGSFTFPLLILFPALRAAKSTKSLPRVYADYFRAKEAGAQVDAGLETWSPRWLRYTQIVFVLYALVTVATLIAQAYTVGDVATTILTVLTATRFGTVWILRAVTLVALGVVLFRTRWHFTAHVSANRALLLLLALGVLLSITQSLNSHGAAATDPPVIPFVVDLIHLLGVVIWIGGLVQLIATLPTLLSAVPAPSKMRTMAVVISSFSLVAFLTVGMVILSGTYSLLIDVGSLEAFFATLYGETLFIKFVLIVPLLALAAVNLIINRNAYARASLDRAIPFIHRLDVVVALEVVFAVAVLLAVGFLTSVAPAKSAYDPSSKVWIDTHKVVDPSAGSGQALNVTLGIAPALVGTNDFDVKIQDAAGQPVSDASVVRLNTNMLEMDMGIQQVTAAAQGNGHYTFHGDTLSMVGTWHVEVLVRRAGHDDARTTFALFTQTQPVAQAGLSPALQDTRAQAGLGLTLVGFGIATATVLLLGRRRERWMSMFGAFAVSIIGLLVVYQVTEGVSTGQIVIVPVVPGFAHLQPNPVRPIPAQIAAGSQVFQQNCATCHGADGKGKGPAAANLNPKPADLTVHAPLHTDGDLYWWVTNGISGTAMPAWESRLTDLQRWQVVTFVKSTFGAATPTPPPPASASQSPSLLLVGHLAADLTVTLSVSPTSGAAQTLDASFSDANKQPAVGIQGATLELTWLDQDRSPTRVAMDAGSDGHYRASGNFLSQPGMWLIRVTAQRASGVQTAAFPFYQAGASSSGTIDPSAQQILKQSDARMNTLKSVTAVQELNDGKNGEVTTRYEYQSPDRLHYQVEGGMESIAIGKTQFDLDSGTWTSRPRVDPFAFPGFDNTSQANVIRLGRTDNLNGAPMQLVETTTGNGDAKTDYAFWIGTDDHLVHQFAMVAAAHFMMQYYSDYNAPIDIQAPTSGSILQRRQVDGTNIALSVMPRAAGKSDFDIALTDASDKPVDNAARVMLVTGMSNMTHGANSILAQRAGGGHYRASGPWIYMGGLWQLGLVVQLADNSTRTATFRLNVPENSGPVESQRVDDSPSPVQQVNELIYSSTIVPARVDIEKGKTLRVTAMLMEPDKTRCGGKMVVPELGLAALFSDAGLAELQFVAPRSGQLRFSCGNDSLAIAIKNPLDPDS